MKDIPPIYFEIDESHRIRISVVGDKVDFVKERKYPKPGNPTNFNDLVVWDTEYNKGHSQYYIDHYDDDYGETKTIPLAWIAKLAKMMVLFD